MDSMTEQGCPIMESTFSLKVKKWAKRKRGAPLTKAVAQNNLKCRFCFHMLQLLCVTEFERESQSYVVAFENAWESKAFWLHRLNICACYLRDCLSNFFLLWVNKNNQSDVTNVLHSFDFFKGVKCTWVIKLLSCC
jgi:hypothetical protein